MSEEDLLAGLLGRAQQPQPVDVSPGEPRSLDERRPEPSPPAEPALRSGLLIATGLGTAAAWVLGSATAIDALLSRGRTGALGSAALIDLVANGVVFGGLLAIAVVMVRLQPIARLQQNLSPLKAVPLGFLIGTGGLSLGLLHAWLERGVFAPPGSQSHGAGLFLAGSLVTLFGAFVEEKFFRGWLQKRVILLRGNAFGIVLSALAFALLHVFGDDRTALSLVNIGLAGVLFGLLALRTGAIWASVAAHFGWNWSELLLFGLVPNPGASSFGSVFDLELVGSPIWGGSAQGLNGSIAVTAVLVALILPFLGRSPRAQRA